MILFTQALPTFSLLADNYWAGLLTPKIIVILFTQALPIFSLLADNYWTGLLTPKIIVILFTQALPTFSVLADNHWAPECTKISNYTADYKFPGVVDTLKMPFICNLSNLCSLPHSSQMIYGDCFQYFFVAVGTEWFNNSGYLLH